MRSRHLSAALTVASLVSAGCGSGSSSDKPTHADGGGVIDGALAVVDADDSGDHAGDGGPVCTPVAADASAAALWCTVAPSPVANQVDGSAIWGFSANDVWAVSDGGLILHYDGSSWTSQTMGTFDLNAIWGAAPDDIWIVGDGGTLLHYDGTAWSPVQSGTQLSLGWIWGTSTGDVWIVGDQGTVMHYAGPDAGAGWVAVDVPVPTQFPDGGVGPAGDGDAPIDLGAVWTDAANDVWIVGDAGVILHFDGNAWTVTPTPLPTYKGVNGIWGTSPNNVWATADCTSTGLTCTASTLLHWDGTGWTQVPSFPGTYDLGDIWGFGPDDIWVTSDFGNLFHYDGAAWTQSPTPSSIASWNSVWGADPRHVWVIGDLGLILQEVP
jgi:hypothetical protein